MRDSIHQVSNKLEIVCGIGRRLVRKNRQLEDVNQEIDNLNQALTDLIKEYRILKEKYQDSVGD